MLEIKNIKKSFKNDVVLDDISFNVKKGEVISIIGESGTGKSTLLRCLNRLEELDEGVVKLSGNNINQIPLINLRQQIGLVFQEFNLFENLTVLENITIGLIKIKKINISEANKIAKEILKKVGLEEKKDSYPDELSGGQKQRVAIARTIAMKPSVILLDEPTSALDHYMKNEVLDLIMKLVKDNMTIIMVTHEIDFALRASDRIIYLDKGKIIYDDIPKKALVFLRKKMIKC